MRTEPIPISTMADAMRPESSDQNRRGFGVGEPGDPMFCIMEGHHHAVADPIYSMNWQSGQDGLHPQEGRTDPVVSNQTIAVYSTPSTEGSGTGAKTGLYCIQENVIGRPMLIGSAGKGYKKDQAFTLNATAPHAVAGPTHIPEVAQPIRLGTEGRGTVNSDGSGNMIAGAIPIDKQNAKGVANPKSAGGIGKDGDPAYTLNSTDQQWVSATVTAKWAKQAGGPAGSASETDNCVMQQTPTNAGRRLTPVECCRLQGFPDDWNDDQTDSQRYRQMGNAVCVPVAEWIGRRIAETIK